MKHSGNDDGHVEPDRYLRQALKHAPDAGLSAPAQVSARIIAAAHQAVERQKHATRRQPGWWIAWLQPPPRSWGGTGALATVLMAVLLTLMWPSPGPGPATDGETTVAQAPAPQVAPPVVPAPPRPPAPETQAQAERPGSTAAAPFERPPERHKRADLAAAPRPAPMDAPPPAAPLPTAAPVEPAPAPAAGSTDAAAAAAADTVEPAAPAVAAAPAAAANLLRAEPPAAKAREATAARARADGAPTSGTQGLPAGMATSPQPDLAGWLQRQAPGLAWRVDDAAPAAASLPWLRSLAASTGNRWLPAGSTPPPPGAITLQMLSAAGEPVGHLVLQAGHVRWCEAAGACHRSALAPEVMAALQRELPR